MKLTPQKIARRLEKAQMGAAVRLVSKVLAPNHFVVLVPEDFVGEWGVFLPRLEKELAGHLGQKIAAKKHLQLCGELQVSFAPLPQADNAAFRIEAGFVRDAQPSASLLVKSGLPEPQSFPLIKPVTIIGRGEVDLALPADRAFISRRHARLTLAAAQYHLEDLNSRAGTFVNDQPVTRCSISSGDRITIGDVVLELAAGGAAS